MNPRSRRLTRLVLATAGAATAALTVIGVTVTAATSCADLAALALPNGHVTLAEAVAAGAFTPPGGGSAAPYRTLPAFCRVAATLTPSTDSEIKIEVWLPAADWNGKFEAVGNSAFTGSIPYPSMTSPLSRGYAVSATNTGHDGGSGRFAFGHPEKLIDFGWRAVHELAEASKRVVRAHYDAAPAQSYWDGCSAGGRQGLKAAQMFPADFDGIVAGVPAADWTGRASQAMRLEQADAGPAQLLQADRQVLHRAAVSACDAQDGLTDGIISHPERCAFDPATVQCKAPGETGCLTDAQVRTARLAYTTGRNPNTGRETAGLFPGSELGWTDGGWTNSARSSALDQFRFIVYADPNWTVARFNWDTDMPRAEEVDANTTNALDPNLGPFFSRGGRLIQYHGWSDAQISPANSIAYYERARAASGGEKADASYRLFLAPGMAHCVGGEGPNTFDMMRALEAWVERAQPPDRILASHATAGRVDRTRPLCPYPQVATYTGAGSIDEAANFACRVQ